MLSIGWSCLLDALDTVWASAEAVPPFDVWHRPHRAEVVPSLDALLTPVRARGRSCPSLDALFFLTPVRASGRSCPPLTLFWTPVRASGQPSLPLTFFDICPSTAEAVPPLTLLDTVRASGPKLSLPFDALGTPPSEHERRASRFSCASDLRRPFPSPLPLLHLFFLRCPLRRPTRSTATCY
jgi:hypothetical protein